MQPNYKPRVKICCISNLYEAQVAIQYGASALGLVSAMPSGPGIIAEDLIAHIAAKIPPGVSSFLLTSKQDTASIIEQQRRCRVNTIQICDRLEMGSYDDLREAMPGIALVQVIHVMGEESIAEAGAVAPHVNALLLDSGNQLLAVKELGGTGRIHNWEISRAIRERVDVPIFLAGGLNAENVVDVCSGVRTDGRLDEGKLIKFFAAIENASPGR